MVVKFSRLPRTARTFQIAWLAAWIIGSSTLSLSAVPVAAQEHARTSENKLLEEAEAAKTLEAQNAVLLKIEKVREKTTSQGAREYLIGLEAWVLHQRGETHAKHAAEANERGEQEQGRELDARAMEDFNAAIGLDPTRWKSYHHRGVGYALMGKFNEALQDFKKTVELYPKYANAWFNLGEIHYELGQFSKAVADYDEAIRQQPKDAGFHTSRGHAYFQLRRFKQALNDYSQAVSLDPKNGARYANRGDAYRSLGEWDKAANDFERAIRLDISFGQAYQSAAWLMATCPDPQFRNVDLAIRSAKKAIELDGDSDYIYLDTLAAALANGGQFSEAQTVLRRAIDSAPKENVGPLRRRLSLYRAKRPFRQSVTSTAQRAGNGAKRS